MTSPKTSPAFGYLGVLIAYNNGNPVGAQIAGHADTLQECLKDGQSTVGKMLEEAPSTFTAVLACVPIPAAPARAVTKDKPTSPTEEQKVTKL